MRRYKTIILFILIFTNVLILLGLISPIQFSKHEYNHLYKDLISFFISVSIISSLFWTIHKKTPPIINACIFILTSGVAYLAYYACLAVIYLFFFGSWINSKILYESKNNPSKVIIEQWYDIGAFGYGGKQIVQSKPLIGPLNYVVKTDTSTINKVNWKKSMQPGDIKWP